ncbi:hypothetical protein BST61_g1529 [Cercospora zeina]
MDGGFGCVPAADKRRDGALTYGPYQERLLETCKNSAVDVINIGFITRFPDQTGTGYPETNFGNACFGDVYQNSTGQNTTLLKTCPFIGPDVIACQQTYGKKIFLSIGGGYPADYFFRSDANARAFADFIWGAWGPVNSSWTGPRPWGDAVVDGFDFDIESVVSPSNRLTAGYTACINRLKNTLYPQDTSKSYYISGAPQCVLPDAHFTTVINRAWFDFLWIQFYNTPQCSARAGINNQNGSNTDFDISFADWTQATSLNQNIKYYIGLPAAPKAAGDDSYYLTPAEVQRHLRCYEPGLQQGPAPMGKGYPQWPSSRPASSGDMSKYYDDDPHDYHCCAHYHHYAPRNHDFAMELYHYLALHDHVKTDDHHVKTYDHDFKTDDHDCSPQARRANCIHYTHQSRASSSDVSLVGR